MGRLVLRRLLATIPVLLLVSGGVFLLIHLTPGDPIDAMMAESVDAQVKETLRRELGLDRPIAVQYVTWMRETWASLEPLIDARRFGEVRDKLALQETDAATWRDTSVRYWQEAIQQ